MGKKMVTVFLTLMVAATSILGGCGETEETGGRAEGTKETRESEESRETEKDSDNAENVLSGILGVLGIAEMIPVVGKAFSKVVEVAQKASEKTDEKQTYSI